YLKVGYKYPRGNFWVTRSRLKCAELLEEQGKQERARVLYEQLAEGEGSEALYAKEKLKKM
ncbi:MAG: hypothetical protein ABH844_04910, partial [Candidatus Omnitrophota bacterium]